MKDLELVWLVLGPVQTNVYIVYNKKSKECFIIDPADRADRIIAKIDELELLPKAILLTHGHFDHIGAVDGLREKYNIPSYITKNDSPMASDVEANAGLSLMGRSISCSCDELLADKDMLKLAGVEIRVIETPGHTRGSCCYYLPSEGVLFSGDTLFAGSYGRCDLEGGSEASIFRSIREKLFTLPDDTLVYPGHMDSTTIGYEKLHNILA